MPQRNGQANPARSIDLALFALTVILAVLTVLTIALPDLRFGVEAPTGDVLINEAALIVASAAAWLAWLRFRHMDDASAAYQSGAFLLFAVLAGTQLASTLGFGTDLLRLDVRQPGQAPIYAWAWVRVVAAALLVRAAQLRLGSRPRFRPATAVMSSIAVAVAGAVAIYAAEPILPAALGPQALQQLRSVDSLNGPLSDVSIVGIVVQLAAVALFSAAALLYARAAREGGSTVDAYLSVGLILAAFAQIHFALFPGAYAGIVSTSDLLRVAFYVCVVIGIQAEAGWTLLRLRRANERLDELRHAEVARAAIAERARLAREVHDGLAQNLWLAKLAIERLGKVDAIGDIAPIHAELDRAIESSIDEAREAIVALRDAGKADSALVDVLTRYAHRFAHDSGLDVRVNTGGFADGDVSPVVAGELLRIAQEALNNVRKHADATVVNLDLERNDGTVTLAVRDNGVGFDTAAQSSGYGLLSMRERAEIAGGKLMLGSAASSGTQITVEVPARVKAGI